MTPEEARALEHGTTPGPWTASECTGFIAAAEGERPVLTAERGDWWCEEDHRLATAAPDMRATIAALRWEYAARWPDGSFANLEDPAASSEETFWTWNRKEVQDAAAELGCSLVRRPAGPVEVVEE